ncbi:carbohydrate-binding domain-containing protein [Eubacteriaceae bacterium ES3]|nr:carbohydrate-binding domain-containing protein [Eubacteriaceae bacterium ES3]
MKRKKLIIPLLITTMLVMAGCSSSQESTAQEPAQTDSQTQVTTTSIFTSSSVEIDTEFTDRDLDPTYDENTAVSVTLNGSSISVSGNGATADGSTLTIGSEGVYILSGTLNDGQIIIDAADTDKIQIVLNGVDISSSSFAPIYVKSADKVFITLSENTENTLTDGSSYTQIDDNNVDGVIFSKADLTINGTGSLTINSNYKNGIVSKDDLVITGGNFQITTVNNALSGKDAVKIADGTFSISAPNGKGIKSQNEDDDTKGYVYIAGGNVDISSSYEGIEAVAIVIADGNINIVSSDDGLNGATENSGNSGNPGGEMGADSNVYISISGGTLNINASGDGIDSNGSLYISGGTVYVSGPTNSGNGALDYNGTADISGGTVVIAGSTGMAQSFSESSTQYSLLYNFASSTTGEIKLTDSSGNVLASFTPDKTYQSVVISTPELSDGQTYTLSAGSQSAEITLSGIVTSNGQTGMGGGMGGGGKGGDRGGDMPSDGGNMPTDGGTMPTDGTTRATPNDDNSTQAESYQEQV